MELLYPLKLYFIEFHRRIFSHSFVNLKSPWEREGMLAQIGQACTMQLRGRKEALIRFAQRSVLEANLRDLPRGILLFPCFESSQGLFQPQGTQCL